VIEGTGSACPLDGNPAGPRPKGLRLSNWDQNCIDFDGRRVQGKHEKDTPMGIPAILIATAISLTMLVMVSDLP
jgi:hypothetical protein